MAKLGEVGRGGVSQGGVECFADVLTFSSPFLSLSSLPLARPFSPFTPHSPTSPPACPSLLHQTRIKKSDASKLEDEYAKLVEGLRGTRGDAAEDEDAGARGGGEEDDFMANPSEFGSFYVRRVIGRGKQRREEERERRGKMRIRRARKHGSQR